MNAVRSLPVLTLMLMLPAADAAPGATRPSPLRAQAPTMAQAATPVAVPDRAPASNGPPGTAPASTPAPAVPPPAASDTVQAVVSLVREHHYRGAALADGLPPEVLSHTRDAFLRRLDPHDDVLRDEDRALLSDAAVAKALAGDVTPVYALAARQAQRLAARARWVAAQHVTDGADGARVAAPPAWRQRYARAVATLSAGGITDEEAHRIVLARERHLAERARARDAMDVLEQFVDAFLAALDPHSGYRPPPRRRAARAGGARSPSDLYGIGAVLGFSGEHVQLERLLKGGAAERSEQLNPGDRIVAVISGEGDARRRTDVVGWAIEDVADLVRGPPGSEVTLKVLPRGLPVTAPPSFVTLTRDRILRERRKVSGRLVRDADGGETAVVRLPSFYVDYAGLGRGQSDYESAASDVAGELLRLQREAQSLDAVLLDLRGNGGGALIEAVRTVGLFIDAGPVVRVRHATGGVEVFADEHEGRLWDGPLAVLVDRYSASASEIVAAALQDYARALIIGEITYGKGSVQEPFDLAMRTGFAQAGGRVSLTTAAFFRVDGRSTQLEGVAPDVTLPVSLVDGRYGERFESWPLPAERIEAATYRTESVTGVSDGVDLLAPARTPELWRHRPHYMRASATRPRDAAAELAALQRMHHDAPGERQAFRERLLENVPEASRDALRKAPLTALWARLILQDTLAIVSRWVHEQDGDGPVARLGAEAAQE